MTDLETLLAHRLEARAERVPVGPIPLDAMRHTAGARRRRPFLVLAAAAAVAVVATAAAVVPGPDPGTAPPVAPSSTATEEPPDGTKRVGIGHLSVEVPEAWSRDVRTACGTPTEDTLITQNGSRLCLDTPVAGVESVQVLDEEPSGTRWDPVEIDGVAARRSEGWCDQPAVPTCTISIWVPEAEVGLLVTSHTDMESAQAILDTVSYDRGLIAVPTPYRLRDGVPLAPTVYVDRLQQAGLAAEVANDGGAGEQRVDSVSPDVGTVVPLGTVVRVGVVAQEPQTKP